MVFASETMKQLSTPTTEFFFSYQERQDSAQDLFLAKIKHAFDVKEVMVEGLHKVIWGKRKEEKAALDVAMLE